MSFITNLFQKDTAPKTLESCVSFKLKDFLQLVNLINDKKDSLRYILKNLKWYSNLDKTKVPELLRDIKYLREQLPQFTIEEFNQFPLFVKRRLLEAKRCFVCGGNLTTRLIDEDKAELGCICCKLTIEKDEAFDEEGEEL